MLLRLTLVADDATTEPVVVRAATGDTVGELQDLLIAQGRLPAGSRLAVGERVLGRDEPLGRPPVLDGAVVRVTSAAAPSRRPSSSPTSSPIRLDVVGGPDAGASLRLTPGRHRIGRGALCELSIRDPHLSRVHAEVLVTTRGLALIDRSSTNGVARLRPDGRLSAWSGGPLAVGDQIRIGTTTLAVRVGGARPLPTTPVGDGTLRVTPSASPVTEWTPVTLTRPAAPAERERPRFPWVQVLVPLPVSAVLAWLWGPQMLVFALLGPLLAGGSALGDRVGARRGARTDRDRHAAALAAHEDALRDAAVAERARLAAGHPDPATVLALATSPSARLWERSPPTARPLAIRLGTGDVLGSTRERSATGAEEPRPSPLPQAPAVLDLAAVGSLGIDGDPDLVVSSATWLLSQVAALVPPGSLSIDVVGEDPAWAWTRLLPHAHGERVDVVATLTARAEAPTTPGSAGPARPAALLVVPAADLLGETPGLADLLGSGAAAGVHLLVLDPHGRGLPAGLGATLHCAQDPAAVRLTGTGLRDLGGAAESGLVLDGIAPWRGETVGRALAPLRVGRSGPGGELPTRVSLAELHGEPTARQILTRWEARSGPVAVVGADAAGPIRLDLRRDGPHALVGGTTGAGKSELLRSVVAGLALGSAPEDLTFVLVDYKGGAAFGDLAGLPHVAALVTDLDAELVERALVSLTAELRRRERVLATTGAPDLEEHLRRGGDRLPRLVIVVDELRALVDELPAFVQGLVRIAGLGRSLGVHLVLATQRPAGVVSADIAANVNLRIALRVRDRVDSEAIVGTGTAATLPAACPGRAVASVAGVETTFQSALVTPEQCPDPPLSVTARSWAAVGAGRPVAARAAAGLAELITEAARLGSRSPAAAPWPAPLPEQLPWSGPARGGIALGLTDVPTEQRSDVLTWAPRQDGHLAIVGAPGSGRSTALVTVIGSAIADDAPWHVQVLASTPDLAALGAARAVGSVLSLHDRELLTRFVDRLEAETAARREDRSAVRASLLVAVDGWDVLAGPVTDLAGHELLERLHGILRDGPGVGIHVVATGGRALVQGRTGERFGRRLALGELDPTEALHLGLPAPRSRGERPPGRGVDVRSGRLCQVARHGRDPRVDEDVRAVLALDRRRPRIDPGPTPWQIAEMPTRVDASALAGRSGAVGLSADLEPIGFAAGDLHVLVSGPRRSGRTTALRMIARAWAGTDRPVLLVTSAPATGVDTLGPDRPDEIVERLRRDPSTALLVDDVDQHGGGPLERIVHEAIATASRRGAPVAVSADSAALVTAFRGPAIDIAARGTGLLLAPRGATDGDLLGVRVRGTRDRVPGRGLLVRDGRAVAIQVATDEPAPAQSSAVRSASGPAATAAAEDSTATAVTTTATTDRPA